MAMQRPLREETTGTVPTLRRAAARLRGAPTRDRPAPAGFQDLTEEGLARVLAWFSIGLGAAEVVAPRALARLIGVPDRPLMLRVLGMREIASGVGILVQPTPVVPMWSRVAGDALDLALLAVAFRSPLARRGRVAAAAGAVAGVLALDIACSQWLSSRPRARRRQSEDGTVAVRSSIAIDRPARDIYGFWRDLQNLPRFMRHLESVHVAGDGRSRWVAKAPAGTTVEWEAEITEDRPDERIAWRSLPGAAVEHDGSVRFERAPGGRGTVVSVQMRYRPLAGVVGAMVARLFGEEPQQQVADDLRRLKQVMETGEIATNEGPSARGERR
jgi:uncharacterized membrane protein